MLPVIGFELCVKRSHLKKLSARLKKLKDFGKKKRMINIKKKVNFQEQEESKLPFSKQQGVSYVTWAAGEVFYTREEQDSHCFLISVQKFTICFRCCLFLLGFELFLKRSHLKKWVETAEKTDV